MGLLVALCTAPAFGQALRLDDNGTIFYGERPMSQRELYALTGRSELIERSDANRARRPALFTTAAVVGGALAIAGTVVIATTPDLSAPFCQASTQRYNEECVPQVRLQQAIGAGLLIGGLLTGAILAGIGYANGPDLLSRREVGELIESYNASQQRTPTLQLMPVIGPDLFALAVGGRF